MGSVDDRVVAMQFDNKAFEDKIATTMGSLDKLKSSLDFANSKRGIDDLSAASKSFQLDGILGAVENVSSKFSAMGAIAFTVLQNIVNRAVDTGIQLMKSLSFEQLSSGFQEYQTNMNSIQTVLANTRADGTNLEDVNRALDELNTYSDQTIYNFGEMARNIGTFTAAGVNLDTSVSAIKGIANLAAISGSNSQQASTAMYQLSQAMATGTVRLMDWNSVVNAGMGGEVFQKALFESGKAMGTLANVPMDTTFEKWTSGGNSFRSSLESGWITTEVLTNTLQGFTGDLTDAQLQSMGYTADQIKEIQALGQTGKEAATKVKTITQLVSTLKESIGSGWSASFRIIIGDFEEARTILSAFSQALGNIAGKSADARNALLQGWKDLGGRNLLIESIVNAFKALAAIINVFKQAFHDIFPPATSKSLYDLTLKIRDFTASIMPGEVTLVRLRAALQGVFAAISIGITVVKEIWGVFADLFGAMTNAAGGGDGILYFFAELGNKIVKLKETLVEGKGIASIFEAIESAFKKFFTGLSLDTFVEKFKEAVDNIKGTIAGVFGGSGSDLIGKPTVITDVLDRIKERFGWVVDAAHGVGDAFDWLREKSKNIKDTLKEFSDGLKEIFGDLPQKIADILADSNYNEALDTINTGLFAGLTVMIAKFFKGGITFDGGLFKNINETFQTLTTTLEAMQAKLKSEVLLNIAKALGLLTVSIVILSLIDSGALTKSMTALAVGFGELVSAMALLDKVASGPTSAASLGILATGLVILAGAMVVMAVAAKILSTMNWEELSKGLLGVATLMGIIVVAVKPLSENSGGMITAGLGLIAIATALNIMALAVKSFAEMNWPDMAKGLAGVAGGLILLVGATNAIPDGMIAKGLGLIAIATALNILALAVKSFAEINWTEMGRGLAGVAASLLVISGAMNMMPENMILQGLGLLAVGIGLTQIAKAVQTMGGMTWLEMAKGLVGIAGALIILSTALIAMTGTAMGATSLGIAALSLGLLADSIKKFSELSWGDLLKGLVGLAAVLVLLAAGAVLMTPVIPALLALGVALLTVGAGFTLIGAGAFLLASAFGIVATAGTQGVAVLLSALEVLISKIPAIIAALADGLIQLGTKVLAALPEILGSLSKVIGALLQLVVDNIPKLVDAFVTFVSEGLTALKELFPQFVETGFTMLMELLRGIRDNIGEIVTVVVEIVTGFLDALSEKVPEIIDSVYNLVVAIIKGVIGKLVDIAQMLLPKGKEFLGGLLSGIIEKSGELITWFTDLPGKIIGWIGDASKWLWNTGINFAAGLIGGIIEKAGEIITWFTELPGKILEWITDVSKWLWNTGVNFIGGLIGGIIEKAGEVITWFTELPGKILGWIGEVGSKLRDKGLNFVQGLINGVTERATELMNWFTSLPGKVWDWIGDVAEHLLQKGRNFISGLIAGIKEKAIDVMDWFKSLPSQIVDWLGNVGSWLLDLGKDILGGLWNGILAAKDWIMGKIKSMADWLPGWFKDFLGIDSPSKVFQELGVNIGEGLALGIQDSQYAVHKEARELGNVVTSGYNPNVKQITDRTVNAVNFALKTASERLGSLEDFNPTITPVLDLSNVEKNAARIGEILGASQMTANMSFDQASIISADSRLKDDVMVSETTNQAPREIKFEQNNYSPEALSSSDIYRQTRNQIALAKEELAVL